MKEISNNNLNESLNTLTTESIEALNKLDIHIDQNKKLEFKGKLIHEDVNTICISDIQGSWIIPKDKVLDMHDENSSNISKSPEERFVSISLVYGSIIHEIRPWKIASGKFDEDGFKKPVEQIFTLHSNSFPDGINTEENEKLLVELEHNFARRIGHNQENTIRISTAVSGTQVFNNGYCDTDCAF